MFPLSHGVVSQVLAAAAPPAAALGGRAIHSETNWNAASITHQIGWRFTVGASDVEVGALMFRDNTGSGSTEVVRLWRVADSSLVTSAEVTAAASAWGETEITPVTLNAAEDYIISRRRADGASRSVQHSPTRVIDGGTLQEVRDPSITIVGSRSVIGDTIPTTAEGLEWFSVNYRTLAPASGYRFYRLHFTAANGASFMQVDEVELRASVGGADETGGGAAWESSAFNTSNIGTKAFDNTAGATNTWATFNGVTDASLYYDFGTHDPQSIAQYTIKCYTTASQAPKDWTLEGSNDLDTWDTLDTVTGETGWSSGETRTFTV